MRPAQRRSRRPATGRHCASGWLLGISAPISSVPPMEMRACRTASFHAGCLCFGQSPARASSSCRSLRPDAFHRSGSLRAFAGEIHMRVHLHGVHLLVGQQGSRLHTSEGQHPNTLMPVLECAGRDRQRARQADSLRAGQRPKPGRSAFVIAIFEVHSSKRSIRDQYLGGPHAWLYVT